MIAEEEIYKTEKENRGEIEYITHYVNRPIRTGDIYGGSQGTCVNGIEKTTTVIKYIFKEV